MDAILELRNVSKVYGNGHTAVKAVDGVDLAVKPGEIVLIMGPSGSGKTTLLSIAGLLLRPTQGSVWLDGRDTTSQSDRQLAVLRLHTLGFVFQAYNLMGALTAHQNVELVMNMAGKRGRPARARARELLPMLGLEHPLHHLRDIADRVLWLEDGRLTDERLRTNGGLARNQLEGVDECTSRRN